jgi:Cof subfamily protein (haloacid dehalogenase superfamily)
VNIKLILCDLDGTLLTQERTILDENVRALQAAMASGIHVAFATGRSPASVAPYVERVKPNAPLIHMNGAMVRDYGTGREIFVKTLAQDVAIRAIDDARAHGFHVNAYVGTEIWIEGRSETSRESEQKDGVSHLEKGPLAAALVAAQARPVKLLCIGEAARIPALTSSIDARDSAHVNLVNSEVTYLEVLPPGCHKLEGARALCAHLGIELSQVVAFGDNKNDLELLEGVGIGVAMGNAHEAVLARVTRGIGTHDTPAIGHFLAELLQLDLSR